MLPPLGLSLPNPVMTRLSPGLMEAEERQTGRTREENVTGEDKRSRETSSPSLREERK